MNKLDERRQYYSKASTKLACLSNVQILSLLTKVKPMHKGIGGTSALLFIEDTPVFVKKIPLTDIELLPQHIQSTANIFELPLYYQYGVGSAGFGAWRELATHIITTNWVISEKCANFPLLYHWRILPSTPNELHLPFWKDIDNYCHYWENSRAIRNRIEALNQASSHIILFLEYVPQNLHTWLQAKILGGQAESAIAFVEGELFTTNAFMYSHGIIHFDAHFKNILTDGELLYFSDFGLALSSQFELIKTERDFLKKHHNYDRSCAAVNLLHCIITSLFGNDQWEDNLRKCLDSRHSKLDPTIHGVIKRYGPIALTMDDFFQQLQKKSKLTDYPADLLENLLNNTLNR